MKAIFFDIDGTLVDPATRQIPKSTVAALRQLQKSGTKLFIATGRHRVSVGFLDEHLPFDGYIAMNGQYCFTKTEVVRKHAFSREELNGTLEKLMEWERPVWFMCEERMYINHPHPLVDAHAKRTSQEVPPILPLEQAKKEGAIYQLCAYLEQPGDRNYFTGQFPHLHVTQSDPVCLDVLPAGGGKQAGLAAMLAHFGISRAETMAFGDGENDIEMLHFAAIGVAMGNACAALKEKADYITTSVHENGIPNALSHFAML